MGCDFYTYYILCIEYKKDGVSVIHKEVLEDTRERHYFNYEPERDEDFEEKEAYLQRCRDYQDTEIQYHLTNYPTREILKNGKWLCVQSAQEKYKALCEKLDIAQETVVSIWKEGGYQYR